MQVIEKTSTRLVLRARPGLLLLLIGGPCLVLALIALARLAQGATGAAGKAALVAALMALTFARLGSAAAAGTLVDRVNAWLDAAR